MDSQQQKHIDDIYKNMSLDDIPWNIETPPDLLVELIDTGKVRPCRAVDLGCGAGNYAIYLATRGFEVIGIDISPTAVKIAKENARTKNVNCNFLVADVVQGLDELHQTWQFAYGWGLLHHIPPDQRQKYVDNVSRILDPAGKYLSVSFSEKDNGFAGPRNRRQSQLGTVLYFSSEAELTKLFETYFEIIDLRTIEIAGKFEPHIFNYVFMQRK